MRLTEAVNDHRRGLVYVPCRERSSTSSPMWGDASSSGAPDRVVFCESCGSIMDEPSYANTNVDCKVCGTTVASSVFEQLVVRSGGAVHEVEADPADASQKRVERVRATVKEACPKCKHPELQYYTMQLRSADEGQTVFYECAKCGHTFSTNT